MSTWTRPMTLCRLSRAWPAARPLASYCWLGVEARDRCTGEIEDVTGVVRIVESVHR